MTTYYDRYARKYAVVPDDVTCDYWTDWWEHVFTAHGACVLRSLRTNRDAEIDAEVLVGRLASGLHRCTIFGTFDAAMAEAHAWAKLPGVGQLGDAVPPIVWPPVDDDEELVWL